MGATRQSIWDGNLCLARPVTWPIHQTLGWRHKEEEIETNVSHFVSGEIMAVEDQITTISRLLRLEYALILENWMNEKFVREKLDRLLERDGYGRRLWGSPLDARRNPTSALRPVSEGPYLQWPSNTPTHFNTWNGYVDLFWEDPAHRSFIKLQLEGDEVPQLVAQLNVREILAFPRFRPLTGGSGEDVPNLKENESTSEYEGEAKVDLGSRIRSQNPWQ